MLAECCIASGDINTAEQYLEAGLLADGGGSSRGLDRSEILMWKVVLAYMAGDSRTTLTCVSIPPHFNTQTLNPKPLPLTPKPQTQPQPPTPDP